MMFLRLRLETNALMADPGRSQVHRPVDKADVANGRGRKGAARPHRRPPRNRRDIGDACARHAGIEKDERNIAGAELIEQVLVHFGSEDGDAIDLPLQHAPNADFHAAGVIVGVGGEHFLPVLHGDLFKASDQLREERIGDVGDDQAVETAAAGAERPGIVVRVKLERLDGVAHSFRGLRARLCRSR